MIKSRIQSDKEEKRQSIRWYKKFPSEFIFFSDLILPDSPLKAEGFILNLSSTGLCAEVNMQKDWEEGLLAGILKIGINTKIPEKDIELRALTKAMWVKKRGEGPDSDLAGIKFIDITTWLKKKEAGANSDSINSYLIGIKFIDITTRTQDGIKEHIISSYLEKVPEEKDRC